jgi:hypothetical protein
MEGNGEAIENKIQQSVDSEKRNHIFSYIP